ncbi:glycosyltransferase [bacterium]|nr:glycosyltransferase [bacterium]
MSPSIPRLAIVLPYLKARGTEKQSLYLANGLTRRGWEVTVLVVQGWGELELYKQMESVGARVVNIGSPWRRNVKGVAWVRFPLLFWYLFRLRPDVVLSRASLAHRITGLCSHLLRLHFVAVYSAGIPTPSRLIPNCQKRWVVNVLQRLSLTFWRLKLGWPERLVTVSHHSLQNLMVRYPMAKSWVRSIVNGVCINKLEPFHYLPKSKDRECVRIVYVGSLEIERKGIDLFLKACRILLELNCFDFHVSFVGSGPDHVEISRIIYESGLDDVVTQHGEQSCPQAILALSDVFVLPSRREGMPNSLLEAMEMGLCVVATDCPTGPSEVINHRNNGLLVQSNDHVSLARSLHEVCLDKGLRLRLGKAARQFILKNHSIDTMLDHYDFLLKEVVSS